jgi:PhnB protein
MSAKPAAKPIPEGFHTVTPYLIVPGADKLIEFLKKAFGAEEIFRSTRPDGMIMHAQMRIGDSAVELADATAQVKPMPTAIHLYVTDTDVTYKSAMNAGATSIQEPTNVFYGDRSAYVQDAFGNHWYIATRVEDLSSEEVAQRAAAQGR